MPVLVMCVVLIALVPISNASYDHSFILKWGESGLDSPGEFLYPQYIAIDSNGSVYVTDLGNKRIQKFDANGEFLTTWGSSGSLPGQFRAPAGITVHKDNVYVVDRDLNRVQKFDLDGGFVNEWGVRGSDDGNFLLPNGIDTDSDGYVYVVDTGNQRVQIFSSDGEYVAKFGSSGTQNDKLLNPTGISIDDTGIYIADAGNNAIKKFQIDGTFVKNYNSRTAGLLMNPHGMQADGAGNIYIADYRNNRILYLDDTGLAITTWGIGGTRDGDFMSPTDVTMNDDGYLYVTDTNGNRIQKFNSPHVISVPISDIVQEDIVKENSTIKAQAQGYVDATPSVLQSPNPILGDVIKPTILPPEDLIIEATGHLTTVIVGYATAYDESGIQSLTNNAPQKFTLGSSTIIWTAIDGSGNLAVASQQITVRDTTPPTIIPINNITMLASHPSLNILTLDEPDVVDALGVISLTNNAPKHFPIGTTAITWTAVDVVENIETFVQYVHMIDKEPPILQAPETIMFEAVSYLENFVKLGDANVTDNSLAVYVTNDAPEYFGLGNTTVTWTATDDSGNLASDIQNVLILDTTAPKFELVETIVLEAVSATTNTINLTAPKVSDIQNFTLSNNAPNTFPLGTTLVTWTAIDAYENMAKVIQNITIIDTTPPIINSTESVIAEATSPNGTTVNLLPPETHDMTSTVTILNDAPELYPLGVTNVTWTALDEYGNNATVVQKITIIDTIPPELTILTDIVAEAISYTDNMVDIGSPNVNDIVGVVDLTNNASDTYGLGTSIIEWTASDESGNIATAIQTVTIVDTQSPLVTAPANVIVEAHGLTEEQVTIGVALATDAVGILEITNNAPETFEFGNTTVIWTAMDISGNLGSAMQNITVQDTIPPSITAPQNVTFEAQNLDANLVELGTPQVNDAVSIDMITNNAPTYFPMGTTLITWMAIDHSDNSETAIQTVIVQDTTAPILTTPPNITTEATSATGSVVQIGNATAVDIDTVVITNNAPSLFPIGTTQVTWTAIDDSGNFVDAVQTVTIQDTIPPIVTAPNNITAEAVAKNNSVEIGLASVYDTVNVISTTNNAPTFFPIGTTQVTWTAIDGAGNQAFAAQQIIIIDSISPIVMAPANITAEAQSADGAKVQIGNATAIDIDTFTITNNATQIFPIGTTQITWTATDASGNVGTAVQTVTIVDTVKPTITAPANVTVESIARNTPVAIGFAKAFDTVSEVSISNNAPESFLIGNVQITWTAVDNFGNSATAIQTVTVQDTTAPIVTTPPNITAEAQSADGAKVQIGNATAIDIDTFTITNNAPQFFPIGITQVTWTATDVSGNVGTAVQTITIVDTVKPTIVAPLNITAEATSMNGTIVHLQDPQVSDETGILSITNDAPEKFLLGNTLVTWTITDNHGNSVNAIQIVNIVDTTPPVLYIPNITTFEITGMETLVHLDTINGTDIVDGVLTATNDASESFGLVPVNVTWTVTDMSGNTATAVQILDPNACGRSLSYYVMTIGTDLDDSIRGTAQPDLMFLLRGDDVVFGERGNDCIFGGQGSDVIFGGEGDDLIHGDEDGDVLRGDSGSDEIFGDEGYDIIDGGDGHDSCNTVFDLASDLTIHCE
ncbi:MAG: NHL repeat-containing protein [Cenarchaeum symbiont of Oopsacas minuta]|nr:NHL repeat-containing protein [Cenarchaeum symbiont of Oopsacas minuta]